MQSNAARVARFYERAIGVRQDRQTMLSMAVLLRDSGNRVAKDVASRMFQDAMTRRKEDEAMGPLGDLVRDGVRLCPA